MKTIIINIICMFYCFGGLFYARKLFVVASNGMFVRLPWLDHIHSRQMNYGVATADVDHDGSFEWIVAGFTGQNFVFKFDNVTSSLINIAAEETPYESLMDFKGKAIGVCACDIDGDGREEIYFLNTNDAYAGKSSYGDKLFKWRNGRYVDIFSDNINAKIDAKNFAGRSVACLDRFGTGKYSFVIATYSHAGAGNFAVIEMDETHKENDIEQGYIVLKNVAKEAGIEKATGGRGIAVGPILNDNGKSDILFVNEGNAWLTNPGSNFLFMNLGNGTFSDVAKDVGILDEGESGRGVSVSDVDLDGLIDIIYGNWEGEHRLFRQTRDEKGSVKFENIATPDFAEPSPVRTVIAADFDSDGHIEIFFNNLYSFTDLQPNKLFKVMAFDQNKTPVIEQIDIGDAIESDWSGTGGSIADMDQDGKLEIILSHGEDQSQHLTVYRVAHGLENSWIRIFVKTKYGAPARGALVKVRTVLHKTFTQIIDGGSGYLCQMEPVAHFGLGVDVAKEIKVVWPDGRTYVTILNVSDNNKLHIIVHPDTETVAVIKNAGEITANNSNHTITLKSIHHEEL